MVEVPRRIVGDDGQPAEVFEAAPTAETNEFIVDNAPALVDEDPTRFGLVDFLAVKGIHCFVHTSPCLITTGFSPYNLSAMHECKLILVS